MAFAEYLGKRDICARACLFSGGKDSGTLMRVVGEDVTHVIHANTGIGVEETRDHVREVCDAWGLPLIEEHPPVSYEELVLERGFPGPAQHWKMYSRLKERCLDQARHRLGVARSRSKAVVFFAGRRREESARRGGTGTEDNPIPPYERDGTAIWVSPMVNWTSFDLATYRQLRTGAPLNPVTRHIHQSGECLCGSYAKPGELDMIGDFYPEVVRVIRDLERKTTAVGIPWPLNTWGWGADHQVKRIGARVARALGEQLREGKGRMCDSCSVEPDPIEPTAAPGGGTMSACRAS